jgi:hypothetical protein
MERWNNSYIVDQMNAEEDEREMPVRTDQTHARVLVDAASAASKSRPQTRGGPANIIGFSNGEPVPESPVFMKEVLEEEPSETNHTNAPSPARNSSRAKTPENTAESLRHEKGEEKMAFQISNRQEKIVDRYDDARRENFRQPDVTTQKRRTTPPVVTDAYPATKDRKPSSWLLSRS